jgi:hypothetical protein
MSEQTHKCATEGCNRQIHSEIKFCVYCQSDLNRRGLCAICGESPRKPKRGRNPQSRTCDQCVFEPYKLARKETEEAAKKEGQTRKLHGLKNKEYRPPEAMEDVIETKTGKVNLCVFEPDEEETEE